MSDAIHAISLPPQCDLILRKGVTWCGADSARQCLVAVAVQGNTIIAINEYGQKQQAALSDIEISARLGSAPRRLVFADGTALMIKDNDAVDKMIRLTQKNTKKQDGLSGWWNSFRVAFSQFFQLIELGRGRAILGLFICAAAILYGVFAYALPSSAKFIAYYLPQSHLQMLSDNVYTQLINQEVLEESRLSLPRKSHIEKIFAEVVVPWQDNYNYQLRIHRLFLDSANAFALPSGLIVMSDKMSELLSDDELLAVFAHEIGHVEARHGMRGFVEATGAGIFLLLLGDVTFLAPTAVVLLQLKYSRAYEVEADCFAANELQRRNLPLTLLGDALQKAEELWNADSSDDAEDNANTERVENIEDEEGRFWHHVLAVLSTHPQTSQRYNLTKVCGIN